jgi:hypothetical protein
VARPRNNPTAPDVTPGQAKWVIQRLISERRLAPGEVQRYVNDMQREISDLERQLEMLRAAHGSSSTSSAASSSPAAGTTGARRGRKPGRKPGRPSNASIAAAAAENAGGEQPVRKRRGRPPRSASANAAPADAGSQSGAGAGSNAGAAKAGRGSKARRTRVSITPEQLASRQLQGRYLALIRQIPASRRGAYAKIAKDKGREAAIRELQDVVKK